MKLNIRVPIKILSKDGYTTAECEQRVVEAFIIRRRAITRDDAKIKRYTYEAHYFRCKDQLPFYDTSMYCKKCAVDVIDRSINPSFDPKKLEFINDIFEEVNSNNE
jgi:hypothetical protein